MVGAVAAKPMKGLDGVDKDVEKDGMDVNGNKMGFFSLPVKVIGYNNKMYLSFIIFLTLIMVIS